MSERISRRKFASVAALGGLALGTDAIASAPPVEDDIASLEAKLAAPLSDEARKIAFEGLKANRRNSTERMKHKLPDISEPCTIYVASSKARKR